MADEDIIVNAIPGAATCVVGFASKGDDCGGFIPPFEWARTFHDLGVATVLMRDRYQIWFQRGVIGVGDIEDVAGYIAELGLQYRRVITVGISMGGYAALLFGALGNATEIIAMSPQTRLYDDWRHAASFDSEVGPFMKYRDIAPLCERARERIRIFIGDQEPDKAIDVDHATRCPHAELTVLPGQTHSSVGPYLRDTGFFRELVK